MPRQTQLPPAPWLTLLQWLGLPSESTVRVVKGNCYQKGFRVRQVKLVTTLLDPELYPAQQILQAYLRRWRLELCLDDLKSAPRCPTRSRLGNCFNSLPVSPLPKWPLN